MDGMNRRAFFKIVGALAAATAMPTTILGLTEATPSGSRILGYIRETFARHIYRDEVMVRFDVLAGDVQVLVDMRYFSEEDCNADLPRAREMAKIALEKEMSKCGKTWADALPLPPLDAYPRPAWVKA